MNPHVSGSLWLILAVICWGIAALSGGFYYGATPGTPSPWRWGLSLGWLGMFFFGLSIMLSQHT